MMNEQRFVLSEYSTVYRYSVIDNIQKGTLKANEIIILLGKMSNEIDEQQDIIDEQKIAIDEMITDYKKLEEENGQLKERLYDFEKRKIIEESRIDEDIIPKVKLLRTKLFGEKYD